VDGYSAIAIDDGCASDGNVLGKAGGG